MKKIVSNILVVSSQLLVGGLFLVMLFSENIENNTVVVKNNNLNKMADSVSTLFVMEAKAFKSEVVIEELKNEESDESIIEEIEESTEEDIEESIENNENTEVKEEIDNTDDNTGNTDIIYNVLETYTGVLTGYGPNCVGCSGITYSGYDVSNTITYNDSEYGEIRIVAADPSFELYTVVRISNIPNHDPIIAIVLDRGSNVGFNRGTLFDLLFSDEAVAFHKTENITFEILRRGK